MPHRDETALPQDDTIPAGADDTGAEDQLEELIEELEAESGDADGDDC